jgi:hypothetical protein
MANLDKTQIGLAGEYYVLAQFDSYATTEYLASTNLQS